MSQLENLADDITPTRAVWERSARSNTAVRLTSPLRASHLPPLDLSPDTPAKSVRSVDAAPGAVPVTALRAPSPGTPNHGEPPTTASVDPQIRALETTLNEATARNEELCYLVESLEEDQQRLLAHHGVLTATIAELNSDLATQREQYQTRCAEVECLTRNMEELRAENSVLVSSVAQCEKRIAEESEQRFIAEERSSSLEVQLDQLKKIIESMESAAKEHRLQAEMHRNEMEAAAKHTAELQSEVSMNKDAALVDRNAAKKMGDELRKRVAALRTTERQNEQLRVSLAEAHCEIDVKFKQLQDVAADITMLGESMVAAAKKYTSAFDRTANPRAQLRSLASVFKALLEANAKLTSAATETKRTESALVTKLSAAETQVDSLNKQLQSRDERVIITENEIFAVRAQVVAEQEKCEKCEKNLKDLRIKLSDTLANNEVLLFRATEAEVALRAAMQARESDERMAGQVAVEIGNLRSIVEVKDAQVTELQSANETLRHALDDARRAAKKAQANAAALATELTAAKALRRSPSRSSKSNVRDTSTIEAEVRRFLNIHGADAGDSIGDALDTISKRLLENHLSVASLSSKLAEERARVKFLEDEAASLSPQCRPTTAQALSPCLFTPTVKPTTAIFH